MAISPGCTASAWTHFRVSNRTNRGSALTGELGLDLIDCLGTGSQEEGEDHRAERTGLVGSRTPRITTTSSRLTSDYLSTAENRTRQLKVIHALLEGVLGLVGYETERGVTRKQKETLLLRRTGEKRNSTKSDSELSSWLSLWLQC